MQIKRLRLSGFKSFVEPAELRIEPGLTGVVGPNGCGKSNLLEALRWVMGESSAKSMRGAGMEDVIFAGTEKRPAREFAEVTLSGEVARLALGSDPDALDADPDVMTDMEVIRRIERGAGSAYRLNGRDVRAKDIALLFADAATGAHSPALVSQGRIAAVIAAKPQARRQMLEEAAGISGLHVRRKDAEQRLRAAEANLARLADLLADMDARIAALRRQARAAERYRDLSDTIRTAEARLIYTRWAEAKAAADAAKAEAAAAEAAVAERGAAHEGAQAAHRSAVEALANARAHHGALRDSLALVEQELLRETASLDRVNDQIAALKAESARLSADGAREDALTRDAAAARLTLTDTIALHKAAIAEAEAALPDGRRRVERAESAVRTHELDLAQAMAEEARISADRKVARAAFNAVEARAARLSRDADTLAREQSALPDRAAMQADHDALAQALAAAETESARLTTAIEATRAALQKAREDNAAAQSDLASARAGLAALTSEAAALSKQLADKDGGDTALSHITAAPGFEVALAAALGEDLQAALGQAGGAARYWAGADATAVPALEGLTRLIDHVTAPDVLASRLSHIWVMDSDDGRALPVGGRLVTRDGALRRWDGYHSHGDGAAAAERLRRVNRLSELTGQIAAGEAKVARAESAVAAANEAMARSAAMLKADESALTDLQSTRRDEERRFDRLINQIAAAMSDSERLAARAATLAEERDELEAERAAAARALADLPDGAAQAARVAELRAAGEDARRALTAALSDQSGAEQALAALKEKRAVAEADLRGWTARAGEAETRMLAMQARAGQVAEELAIVAAKPAGLQDRIATLNTRKAAEQGELAERAAAEAMAQAALTTAESAQSTSAEMLAQARESRATALARAENQDARRIEMGRISGERFECPPPLLPERAGFDVAELGEVAAESARLEKLQADRERIGPVNLLAADELAQLEGEQGTGQAEAADLTEAIHRLRGSIGALNREGRQRLLAAFEAVNAHFGRLFSGLFGGGEAHLALIESDDPLEAGLEIMAQPPGKKLASLTLLSGGEQALTAVALIFGLFLTNPAPICVLDEVDAPLDDANVERFCDLLDRMVAETNTRYLIVTHNAVTMSRMHRLFGVTMVEQGVSRLVSVDLGAAEALLAEA